MLLRTVCPDGLALRRVPMRLVGGIRGRFEADCILEV